MQPQIPNQDKIQELIDKAVEKRIAELMKDYHLPTKEIIRKEVREEREDSEAGKKKYADGGPCGDGG